MNTDPKKSALNCGCDAGAQHVCQRHEAEGFLYCSMCEDIHEDSYGCQD